jgi:hypothetical protein
MTAPTVPSPALATGPAPPNHALILLRGLAGAAIGGAIGYFLFRWLARNGFYGIMVPGALLGLGAGLTAGGRSQPLAILCALAALGLAIFAEWSAFPFVKDGSFSFFLAHVHQLPPIKLIMMGLGALCAYWFGQGR